MSTASVSAVPGRAHPGGAWRLGWTILTILAVQTLVCGAAILPVVVIWSHTFALTTSSSVIRAVAFSILAVPSYVLFAVLLMFVSAATVRTLRWETPANVEMRIADLDWPLLQWARSMVATHVVRFFAGALFRGSPVWTAYLRRAGARIGRRVYVNSLAVTDYNLLEFGDDVVIGDGVHLSGHTVEGGVVKTAALRLGRNVTIGLGTVLEIGVEVGDGCQLGALSFVPKFTRLDARAIYAGIPAQRLAKRTAGRHEQPPRAPR
jgi:acetyltransferase-like isoleucine patch superfamily enzyme